MKQQTLFIDVVPWFFINQAFEHKRVPQVRPYTYVCHVDVQLLYMLLTHDRQVTLMFRKHSSSLQPCAADFHQPIACIWREYRCNSLNEYSNKCMWCHPLTPLQSSLIHNGASPSTPPWIQRVEGHWCPSKPHTTPCPWCQITRDFLEASVPPVPASMPPVP